MGTLSEVQKWEERRRQFTQWLIKAAVDYHKTARDNLETVFEMREVLEETAFDLGQQLDEMPEALREAEK